MRNLWLESCKNSLAGVALLIGSTTLLAQYTNRQRQTYTPPPQTYTPPPRQTYTPPPRQTYTPPPRQTYTPPPRQTYTPPPQTYTPPPRQTYTPPPRQTYTPPPRQTYTPPPRQTYTPSPQSNTPQPRQTYTPPARSYTPSPSPPVHSYTPGSSSTIRSVPSSSGSTTYTPHTYTPGTTSVSRPAASGNTNVRYENGVTTYTPRTSASGRFGSSNTAGRATYSPSASPARSASLHSGTSGTMHPVYSLPAASVANKSLSGSSRLTTAGSSTVLRQVNSARVSLSGINKRSIPHGEVTVHSNGNLTVNTANGRQFNLRQNGTLASLHAHGVKASFLGNGRLASVHTASMDIARGPRGQRTIVTRRANRSMLVSTGRHSGYLQRSVFRHGHNYIQRTYVRGGFRYSRVYTTYSYHGIFLDTYVPGYYYAPAFYGWAYYPWGLPVTYSWGWAGAPWFGYYGGYYSPWAAYASGAEWLTDYYLSQTLADAYEEQAQMADEEQPDDDYADAAADQQPDDGTYAQSDTPISQQVKDEIAQQVQQQLAYENAASAQPQQAPSLDDLPQIMQPGHLFVVDQALNAAIADDQSCGLSAGDVLQLTQGPAEDSPAAGLQVVSSRRADCPAGVQISLSVENLQEMQNNFRAQLDSGLKTLHDQQGQGGLPGAPHSAIAPPPRPTEDLPPDDENVQAMLQSQQQQANLAEASVTQEAFTGQQ